MTLLTVICTNDECMFVFPGDLDVINARNVSFSNCYSGKCPKCGSPGRIPDGTYNAIENKIYSQLVNINDIVFLKKIESLIRRDLGRNKSPKNIRKSLKKKFPKYLSLWKLIPETKQDAYSVINIILATIAVIAALNSEPDIKQETTINNTTNITNEIHIHDPPSKPPKITDEHKDEDNGDSETFKI